MTNSEWKKEVLKYWMARMESTINSIDCNKMTEKQYDSAFYALSGAFDFIWELKMEIEGDGNNDQHGNQDGA